MVTVAEFPCTTAQGQGSRSTVCLQDMYSESQKQIVEFLETQAPGEWAVRFRRLQWPASCDPGGVQGGPGSWSLFTL